QVVLVRDGDRTVMTMANDFKGDPSEFAVVIPVPTLLEREQIHVGNKAVIDHLDAYTSPRLVEYFDSDPCAVRYPKADIFSTGAASPRRALQRREEAETLGVTIEASYTVGEYDILILSAEQSDGLETWLKGNGYRIPDGAGPVLQSYLKQDMRFFVAKVNLEEQAKTGFQTLRPLQVAYESKKFMLPIRLGTVNANGPQELFVYALTRKGRVETTNYRTVRLPTGMDLPVGTKERFAEFYKAMFQEQTRQQNGGVVFLEYAWDMNWCDPCAADPLSDTQLRELGVFWIGRGTDAQSSGARDVFVTRLHVRYDREHFPEDLKFQETADRGNFQGRYIVRHPFNPEGGYRPRCPAAKNYWLSELPERYQREASTLANLTGWDIASIRDRMPRTGGDRFPIEPEPWWERLWGHEDK
ncbi:MAG: DUF2330 domain-containing protein, partial [Gammaproteobacteria bacterium]